MKKVLYILGEFEDDDAEWLVRAGRRVDVPDGEPIIREGEPIDALFFVTGGSFRVTTGPADTELARLGAGEVLGEISFIDDRPPTATVTALQEGTVLSVSRSALARKLETDPGFASRFYRALAVFLADRLRAADRKLAEGGQGNGFDELDLDELHAVSQAGVRFERILQRLQQV